MTPFQIVALSALAVVLLSQFVLPNIKLPKKQNDTLKQIASVIAIKDSSSNPKVVEACNQLLSALIA